MKQFSPSFPFSKYVPLFVNGTIIDQLCKVRKLPRFELHHSGSLDVINLSFLLQRRPTDCLALGVFYAVEIVTLHNDHIVMILSITVQNPLSKSNDM